MYVFMKDIFHIGNLLKRYFHFCNSITNSNNTKYSNDDNSIRHEKQMENKGKKCDKQNLKQQRRHRHVQTDRHTLRWTGVLRDYHRHVHKLQFSVHEKHVKTSIEICAIHIMYC